MKYSTPARPDSPTFRKIKMLDQTDCFKPSPRFRLKRKVNSVKIKPSEDLLLL